MVRLLRWRREGQHGQWNPKNFARCLQQVLVTKGCSFHVNWRPKSEVKGYWSDAWPDLAERLEGEPGVSGVDAAIALCHAHLALNKDLRSVRIV